MADFKRVTNTNWYLGASTDTKPGAGTCPVGSSALETDTGALFYTPDGGTTWTQVNKLVKLVAGTAEIGKLAAGTALIGKVGIDQTTPGTTNAVQPKAADGTALFAVPPQLDSTDRIAVSLYGKATAAGDTPLQVSTDRGLYVVQFAVTTALADGIANTPTQAAPESAVPFKQASLPHLLNPSSTWDRARSIAATGAGLGVQQVGTLGELITLAASAARTESANGTAVTGLGWRNRYIVLFDLTVADTDAGDTLDVYVDVSLDGNTWLNAIHFTQIIGTDAASKRYAVLDPAAPGTSEILVTADAAAGAVRPSMFGPQMRARWAITDAGADDASFTFSVAAYAI